MLNKVILQGRLAKEPEQRYTQNNTAVTSFTLAVDRSYQSGGERKADFLDCVAWRHTAEFISKYFHKGDMVLCEGELQKRLWEDNNGNKRSTVEVIVSGVNFCGSKSNNSSGGVNVQFEELPDDEGDLPF